MKDQVPEQVMIDRHKEIMEVQKGISESIQQTKVGQIHQVLVKGVSEESEFLYEGRLSTQAPEVDGCVYINDGQVKIGEIQLVEITDAFEYDLVGRIVDPAQLH
jgi:ribosomal protein S12 methylthiotransferase